MEYWNTGILERPQIPGIKILGTILADIKKPGLPEEFP